MYSIEDPAGWGLPHEQFRPYQLELIQFIMDAPTEWVLCESPTGTGKSALAAAVGSRAVVTSIVETRDLQQQYHDIYGFDIVWGKEHYPCVNDTAREYLESPTADDCILRCYRGLPDACRAVCPYEAAKRRAAASSRRVLNYAYAWWTNWWRDSEFVFCDEGHLLPAVLTKMASVEISERSRVEFGLPEFPHLIGASPLMIQRARKWVEEAEASIHILLARRGQVDAVVNPRWAVRLVKLQQKLAWLESSLVPDEWYLHSVPNERFTAKPIWPSPFTWVIASGGKKKVLMSATIGDPELLAKLLGIQSFEFRSVPHSFPPENRPIYLHPDAPRISAKSRDEDYYLQARLIRDLAEKHKHERGLIHTASWYHTQLLQKYLIMLGLGDRLWVLDPRKDRVQQILWMKSCEKDDLIAMGPSFTEGISLDDDLCRWIVVAKTPWKDLSDPIVSIRLRSEFGKSVYDWEACLDVVQACGRGVRSPTDYCVSYILDRNFRRVKRYLPSWVNYIE